MSTYEVTPTGNNDHRPFTVLKDGQPTRRYFDNEALARNWVARDQDPEAADVLLFNDFFQPTGTDTLIDPESDLGQRVAALSVAQDAALAQVPVQVSIPDEEIGLDGEYTVGQEVTVDGAVYIVEKAFYVDAEMAAFAEDMDESISVGWHANARLKGQGNV